jgi:hypothetical protein
VTLLIALPIIAILVVVARASDSRREALIWLPVAAGCGLGLSSIVWWGLLVAGITSRQTIVILDVGLWLCLIGIFAVLPLRRRSAAPPSSIAPASRYAAAAAGLVLAGASATALATFASQSIVFPHGEWDAWAIWNLRARFFFHGFPDQWRNAFDGALYYSHPNYPLLLPLSIARAWTFAGADTVWVPVVWAAVFTAGAASVAGASVARTRGSTAGMFAGAAVLASPAFVRYGSWQIADVPLSFFIVATFALLARAVERESQPAWWILAGLAAGLAAWTKNEGLLFAGALAVAAAVSAILKCSVFPSFKSVAWFAAGMAPCVLAVVEFKTAWALPNRFLAAQSLAHLSGRVTELERLQTITASMAGELWHSGGALVGPLPLVVLYAVLRGRHSDVPQRCGWLALATSALSLTGYVAVYMLTHLELQYHLDTSLGRVCVHYLPTLVWGALMISR